MANLGNFTVFLTPGGAARGLGQLDTYLGQAECFSGA